MPKVYRVVGKTRVRRVIKKKKAPIGAFFTEALLR
jgi:hypothetical protein